MFKFNLFKKNNQIITNQNGRSMTEMLGVLAIIGILSLMAISGFSYATAKNQANTILNDIKLTIVILDASDFLKGSQQNSTPNDLGVDTSFAGAYLIKKEGKNNIVITASPLRKQTCKILVDEKPAYLEDIIANPTTSHQCEDNEFNSVSFYINQDFISVEDSEKPQLCDDTTACLGCQTCIDGRCVDTDEKCTSNQICEKGTCTCPPNYFKDNTGKCRSCDEVISIYVDQSDANIQKVLSCPKMTYAKRTGIAAHCNVSSQTLALWDSAETCSKCDNRSLASEVNCSLECPADQFRDNSGNCHSCDEVATIAIDTSEANKQRILNCPKMVLSRTGLASHCNVTAQTLPVWSYPQTCAKCDNRVLISEVNCSLPCPDGQFWDSNGQCHSCDEVAQFNVSISAVNIQKILDCPKMVLSSSGVASHCDVEIESVPVGYPETCNKCDNRTLSGQSCVKN